jgi:putative PEP-CTERM system TPR-repeat lipoprotein
MKSALKIITVVALTSIILTFYTFAADRNYEAALQSYQQQEYDTAYIYLKNALQTDPKNLAAKLLLGKLFTRNGYYDEAIREFKEALEYQIDIELVLVPLGNVLLFNSEYEQVLDLGKGYKLTKPSKFEWHMLSATAYSELNKLPLARNEYRKAIMLYPNNIRALNSLVFMNLSNGDYTEALQQIESSLKISPRDARTWHLKGKVSEAMGNLEQAIENYTRALTLNSDDPVAMRSKAYALISADRIEEARELSEKIIAQTPDDPFAMLLKSWILSKEDNSDLANSVIENLSNQLTLVTEEQYAKQDSLLFVKGMTAYIQGNFEQARVSLGKYVKSRAGDINAISMLAEIYVSMGQTEAATHLLGRNEDQLLTHLPLALKLADLYLQTGKDFKAEFWLGQLRERYPDDIKVILMSSKALIARNKIDSAIKLIEDSTKKFPKSHALLLARGMLYVQTGRFEDALKVSDILIKNDQRSVDNWNLKAAALIRLGQYDLATEAIENVLAISPQHFAGRFNQAMLFKNTDQLQAAKKILSSLVEENPRNGNAVFQLALLESQTGEIKSATSRLEDLSILERANHNASILLLDLYLRQGRNSDALARVKRLTKDYPFEPEFAIKKAEALIANKLIDDAKVQLVKLYSLWLDSPEKLYRLSNMQQSVADFEGASNTLKQALSYLPKHLLLNLEYARLNLQLGETEIALNVTKEMEKRYGEHANISLLNGDIFLSQEKFGEAHGAYLKAAQLQPDYQLALARLYELAKRGTNEKAFNLYITDLVKKHPENDWRRKLLADHLINQGKWDEAKSHYLILIAKKALANNSGILNNLANIYLKTDIEKAHGFAKRAYNNAPTNPQVLDTYGWVLVKKQQYEDAINYLRQAHAIESNDPSIRYHIAYTLRSLGRIDEAKAELEVILSNFQKFPEREDAITLKASL